MIAQIPPILGMVILTASLTPELWQDNLAWFLRIAAFGLWLMVSVSVARPMAHGRQGLASPIYLLPTLALLFYSLIPAAVITWMYGPPVSIPDGAEALTLMAQNLPLTGGQSNIIRGPRAVASTAELWVLRFAVGGLVMAWLSCRRTPPIRGQAAHALPDGLATALGLAALGVFFLAKPQEQASPLAREAAFAAMPVFAYCLAWLAEGISLRKPLRTRYHLGLLILAAIPILAATMLKFLAILMAVAAVSMVDISRIRRQAAILVCFLVAMPVLLSAYFTYRTEGASVGDLRTVWGQFIGKAAIRQGDTVFCAEFALRDTSRQDQPLYFMTALVPRTIWPGKPSLSPGDEYAVQYCGDDPYDVKRARHSASITLLGEPIVRGGPLGLALALAILAGGLTALSRLWRSGTRASASMVMALSPWTLDFDQHFALYLANGVKAALCMLPVAALAHMLIRWKKPPQAEAI